MSILFRGLWRIAGFRSSFASLNALSEERIEAISKAFKEEEDLGLLSATLTGDEGDHVQHSVSVLQTLSRVRDQDGIEDLVADVEALAGDAGIKAAHVIRTVLREDPQQAERRRYEIAQHSGLPVLVSMSVEVDFRVAPPLSGTSDQPKLVPVLIVRLVFDEEVGGQDAIVFQVDEQRVGDLSSMLEKADGLRSSVLKLLPESLVFGDQNPSQGPE